MTDFDNVKFDVLVIGGANTDYLIWSKKLPRPGETVQGGFYHESVGGKATNQAVAAARLGANVGLIAKLGMDQRAQFITEKLKHEGINTKNLLYDNHTPTGVALISVGENGEKQITVAPGANKNFSPSDIHHFSSLIRSCKILLIQLEIPLESVKAAIEIASEAKVFVILDPAPAVPLSADLLKMVKIIKPNANEAETLTGIKVIDRKSAKKAAKQLLSLGVKTAIVQAGDEGDLVLNSDEEIFLPRFKINAVDATGAGDAFLGALATYLSKDKPLSEAAKLASAAAALKTKAIGAQSGLPLRQELENFLKLKESKEVFYESSF